MVAATDKTDLFSLYVQDSRGWNGWRRNGGTPIVGLGGPGTRPQYIFTVWDSVKAIVLLNANT